MLWNFLDSAISRVLYGNDSYQMRVHRKNTINIRITFQDTELWDGLSNPSNESFATKFAI